MRWSVVLGAGGNFSRIAAGFSLLTGGAGGLLGTWNTYRGMEGLPDWMTQSTKNAFDHLMYLSFLVGAVIMIAGLTASAWLTKLSVSAIEIIGGVLVMQSGLFIAIRALMRRATRQEENEVLQRRE
jgi:hypothetical protein